VIKTTIYTTDVDAFLGASMANRERTSATKSATTLIGVTRLAFPALMVEIEAIAVA
jgi:enamine deaminase RidA (YjgF/YER057c/UK114 family)